MGRKAVGVELKKSYWEVARRNLMSVRGQSSMFDAFDLATEDCASL